jgi:hypothetical protein
VVDVSDPESPLVVGSLNTPVGPRKVAVAGTHAYLASRESGLLVIDVSDPTLPRLIGGVGTRGTAEGVVIEGECVHISDGYLVHGDSGLLIAPTECEPPSSVGGCSRRSGVVRLSLMPNPGRGETWISLDLPGSEMVRLEVCDPTGRSIRRLVRGRLGAGSHRIPWNGRDDSDLPVAGGVYIVRLDLEGGSVSRRLIVLR